MKAFASASHPLGNMSLVEASAGTGKTHAITTLVVRALLEESVPLSRILVVTYTRAATAELRVRVRQRVLNAMRLLDDADAADPDLAEIIERACAQQGREQVRSTLLQALDATDRAPIHTIHGFCQRLLHEFPIQFGVDPGVEIIQNDWPLRRQLAGDFWINELDDAPPWLIIELQRRRITTEALARLAALPSEAPVLGPPEVPPDTEVPIDELRRARAAVLDSWQRSRREISELLLQSAALNRTMYQAKSIGRWVSDLDRILHEDAISLPKWFGKLTEEGIEAGTKRGHAAPSHSFFGACSVLASLCTTSAPIADAAVFRVQRRFVDLAREATQRRIEESRLLTYDDLVRAVHRGLVQESGAELCATVRERYSVALIDEFQDTDALQYDIFRRIYGGAGTAVFVGDPKQAIYAFRGADVFSYLRAAQEAPDSQYTMLKNWRSVPRVVQATNALFGTRKQPFIADQIAFRPAVAARSAEMNVSDGIDIVEISGGKAAPSATAAEVTGLLSGTDPKAPRDIAVLCRTNAQASEIAGVLRDHEVPVSLGGDLCVFDTDIAADVEIMLEAIYNPTSTRTLRRLLFTETIGFTPQQIVELDSDDGWMAWQVRALRWNEVSRAQGAGRALTALFADTDVERGLAQRQDGRRTLTDLHHLHELVHRVEHDERLDLAGTLRWFRDVRGASHARNDLPEEELHQRPDGATDAVRVTTIHKSKGLEYGVVVLPHAWSPPPRGRQEQQVIRFHDPNDNHAMKLDLGSENRQAHIAFAKEEDLSESLRLLYVAVTRARHRCIILLPRTEDWHRSSFGYLLDAPKEVADQDRVLADLVARSEGAVTLRSATETAGRSSRPTLDPSSLEARTIQRTVHPTVRVTSFTDLARRAQLDGLEDPALDEPAPLFERDRDETRAPLAELPGGARTGLLVHDILEQISWANFDSPATEELVRARLLDHGFGSSLVAPLVGSLREIGAAPLFAGGPSLAAIEPGRQNRELEFTLRLSTGSAATRLSDVWADNATDPAMASYAAHLRDLEASTLRRFLRGFIDLVFEHEGRWYVVDYKTNVLPGYARADLQEVMTRHHYVLQYHLYTLALDRYLRQRVKGFSYDEHFGGALFMFLRGISATPGEAVFADKPPAGMITALGNALGGGDA